jgi:hypothetical protein
MEIVMTNSEDYRLYLDERFKSLTTLMNAYHIEAMESNDRIEEHVIQTNGRVTELECESLKRKEAVADFRRLEARIRNLGKRWIFFLLGGILFVVVVTFLYDIGAITSVLKSLFSKV